LNFKFLSRTCRDTDRNFKFAALEAALNVLLNARSGRGRYKRRSINTHSAINAGVIERPTIAQAIGAF
jgi:hypothetical protein